MVLSIPTTEDTIPKLRRDTEERLYRASDVKRAAGLSYRQLHDWDSKGVLPPSREEEANWRKFTLREIFAVMVCAEIRKQFGVPLESLRWVRAYMLQEEADHFRAAAELMASLGIGVYLLTDLKKTFIMDSELEFGDLMRHGYFMPHRPGAYIFLSLNHLVNRLLGCLKEPINLELHGRGHDVMHRVREAMTVANQEELEVLDLLREPGKKRITVQLKDGAIIRADVEGEVPVDELGARAKTVMKALEMGEYEKVTVTTREGKIVHVDRKTPIKFKSSTQPRRAKTSPPEPQEEPGRRGKT